MFNLTSTEHCTGFICSLASAASFHFGDLWFLLSVKALNKNTALCHTAANRTFFLLSPSVCVCVSSPVMYWIYSSSNYEIWGYRSIILSSHATQTSFWGYSEVTADAVTYLSVLRYENTDGFHSAWDADISRLFHSKILSGSFDVPQLAF